MKIRVTRAGARYTIAAPPPLVNFLGVFTFAYMYFDQKKMLPSKHPENRGVGMPKYEKALKQQGRKFKKCKNW